MLRVIMTLLLTSIAQAATPEIIAHRGASFDAPENTLAAIKLAWEQQADGSEFDVYLTKDGKIAVLHDQNTKRTSGVSKLVHESTLEELRTLDIGKWKHERFAGEKIPTLEEMLATVTKGKKVFIEVKCGPEIVPQLVRVLEKAKLAPEQTPVISFNSSVIGEFKKARPDVPAYWLLTLDKKDSEVPTAASLIEKAKKLHADGLDLSASKSLTKEYAQEIRDAGLKLYVWTVNDPVVAKRMAEVGVHGITTDRPQWLREQLGK